MKEKIEKLTREFYQRLYGIERGNELWEWFIACDKEMFRLKKFLTVEEKQLLIITLLGQNNDL